MQKSTVFCCLILGLGPATVGVAQVAQTTAPAVVDHPSQLEFGNLDFQVPDGERFRHTLSNGVVVYVVEDHQLPLVDVTLTARLGSFLDPDDRPGLAATTGAMLRRGGTEALTAEEFDEKVEFLAAEIDSSTSATRGSVSLNCISPVLEESLDLLFEMLRTPGFQEDRLQLEKEQLLEEMKQRNDTPQAISRRNWAWLMRGMDSFLSRQLTAAEVETISRQDLQDFHRRYWQPKNLIVGVSGDVAVEEILASLERRFEGWSDDGPAIDWPPVPPAHEPEPGVYYLEKEIPQGRVLIGHLGYQRDDWDDPDVQPLAVMNEILGGGGFTSRLVKRIRSDEGLAYSAFSQFGIDSWWPGVFNMGYQSKSATVALAAKIALEEMERMRSQEVTDEELATAKASFVEVFPRQFESAASTARIFVRSEYEGRPLEYWQTYRDRVNAVSKADVLRVAREHLHPDQLVTLIVGSWQEIVGGDAEGRATMADVADAPATALPLRDPLSLEPQSD